MAPRFSALRASFGVIFVFMLSAGGVFGYALEGPSWPPGSTIDQHLAFTAPGSGHLQDGFTSFNASAADALNIWNQQMQLAKFAWTTSSIGGIQGDGQNTAFFSATVYGQTYGSALAVTIYYFNGSTMKEVDNVFNSSLLWDSYRGPLQYDSRKQVYIYDFHRVALHEFGHTLGLAHPDDVGQHVIALMNSHISDLDHLAADDFAGIKFLYEAKITSSLTPSNLQVGSQFNYQITANNNPTSFGASGLPDGLNIDTVTGQITGSPSSSGSYRVLITAYSPFGNASATLRIQVVAGYVTSPSYAPEATVGSDFLPYQITATNQPTSFGAVGLPSGLTIDSATGIITGTPGLTGSYVVTLIAHGVQGDVFGSLTFSIKAAPPLQPAPGGATRWWPISAARLVYDANRSRVYASDPARGVITVIDAKTLNVVDLVKVDHSPWGMSISANGSKLWYAATEPLDPFHGWVGAIALDSLDLLPRFRLNMHVYSLEEGIDGRLYASSDGETLQLNSATGAIVATLAGNGILAITPDRRNLFAASFGNPATIWHNDISQSKATLVEQTDFDTVGEASTLDLKVDDDGQRLCYANSLGNQHVRGTIATSLMPADNIRLVLGNFLNGVPVGPVAFHPDGSIFYQAAGDYGAEVQIFDAASFAQTGSFPLTSDTEFIPGGPGVSDMTVDSTGGYIFLGIGKFGYVDQLRVYSTGRGTPPPLTPSKSLLNISTRAQCLGAAGKAIGGFIIQGQDKKRVLARASGPSLKPYGIKTVLSDPALTLHDARGLSVTSNDNWNTDRITVLSSGLPPGDEHEAAIVATLAPGAYTVVLDGAGDSTGIALFELYDLAPQSSKIRNISTRGNVGTGDNIMIGGFIVGGDQATNVVVRALGPTLTDFGVTGALADPTLELRNGNGALITQNDDWKTNQQTAIQNSGYAPPRDSEAAILTTLQPGNYTAIVRGKNDTTGVALVEVYNLDAN